MSKTKLVETLRLWDEGIRGFVTLQLEGIACGRDNCGKCPHGPYWYGYWTVQGRTRKKYLGKRLSKFPRVVAKVSKMTLLPAHSRALKEVVRGMSADAKPLPKKAYAAPKLSKLGTVKDLTSYRPGPMPTAAERTLTLPGVR